MSQATREFFLSSLHGETTMTAGNIAHGLHSISFLEMLELYRQDLKIAEIPEGTVTVIPGTDNEERELGSQVPVYTKQQLLVEPVMEKTLYNLRALTGFQPQ